MADIILKADNLFKHYPIKGGVLRNTTGHVKAVDGVSFELNRGETLGIVGESGCGKSTLGRVLMRLEEPTSGTVNFDGVDMYSQSGSAMRKLRRDIQIVFQDPYTSLNPRKTVGDIIGEPFEIHPDVVPKGGRKKAVKELLDLVGLNPEHINRYPHQFSGGQRQRIGCLLYTSPTASVSCTSGAWSSSGPRRRSTSGRPTPTRRPCCRRFRSLTRRCAASVSRSS